MSSTLRFHAMFVVIILGIFLSTSVIAALYDDEVKAMNAFCIIGKELKVCSNDGLNRAGYNIKNGLYRNVLKFCCVHQNGSSDCPKRETEIFYDQFCKHPTSVDEVCCTACGMGHQFRELDALISDCCICGDRSFMNLKRPESFVKCRTGFYYNQSSKICEDINECEIANNGCDGFSQDCRNTLSSYQCIPRSTCKSGYIFDESKLLCRKRFSVVNFPSLHITCAHGYKYDSTRNSCDDIDECLDNNLCSFQCQNLQGSFECVCPKGFKIGNDGRTCLDVNECGFGNVCPGMICNDIFGGHRCYEASCPRGYKGKKLERNRDFLTCFRKFCNKKSTCLKQPKYWTFKNVTLSTSSVGQELHVIPLRQKERKNEKLFVLKVKDLQTGISVIADEHFEVDRQQNRIWVLLKKPFTKPQQLKVDVLISTGSKKKFTFFMRLTMKLDIKQPCFKELVDN